MDSFPAVSLPRLDFRHRDLVDDTIRLVRLLRCDDDGIIHGTIHHESGYFESGLEFTALSYCWGSLNKARIIMLNGRSVNVTTNLYDALWAVLAYHDTGGTKLYWIDALCINQGDLRERNNQVQQMWRIFHSAFEVLAWLGPENEHTKSALTAIDAVASRCRDDICYGCYGKRPLLAAVVVDIPPVKDFLTRNYFARTWIILEVVQAQRLRMLCGPHSRDFHDLYHFLSLEGIPVQTARVLQSRQQYLTGSYAIPVFHRRLLEPGTRPYDPAEGALDKLEAALSRVVRLLQAYGDSACSDARDRIFALMGDPRMRMLDLSISFKADYSLTKVELAVLFVAHCDSMYQHFTSGTTLFRKAISSAHAAASGVRFDVEKVIDVETVVSSAHAAAFAIRVDDVLSRLSVALEESSVSRGGIAEDLIRWRKLQKGPGDMLILPSGACVARTGSMMEQVMAFTPRPGKSTWTQSLWKLSNSYQRVVPKELTLASRL